MRPRTRGLGGFGDAGAAKSVAFGEAANRLAGSRNMVRRAGANAKPPALLDGEATHRFGGSLELREDCLRRSERGSAAGRHRRRRDRARSGLRRRPRHTHRRTSCGDERFGARCRPQRDHARARPGSGGGGAVDGTARRGPTAARACVVGAKEGGAFLDELTAAGFAEAELLRTVRNLRTSNPSVIAAEMRARR